MKKNISKLIIATLLSTFLYSSSDPTDGCDLPENTIYLLGEDVLYNSNEAIAGFQFTVDGASASGGSGGDAGAAGFVVSAGGSTVLGFSFTGASFGPGCGTMVSLALDGDATGLSGIVISDTAGSSIDFSYYEGGDDCASGIYDCLVFVMVLQN